MSTSYPPYFGYYTADIFDCPPFEMFSNNDDPRAAEIIHVREFEPHSMRIWCARAPKATGIIDIGAHVGVYALAAASLRRDLTIYALEGNPHAFARLRVNKDKNGFKHIHDELVAVAAKSGYVHFSWGRRDYPAIPSGGHMTASGGEGLETAIVRMEAVDNMSPARELGPRGLVKIDVEGAEAAVFWGMANTLAAYKPDIILETFNQGNCDYINSLIVPLGYRVFGIDEHGDLEPRPQLVPAVLSSKNFNQFLTVDPAF